MDTFKSDHVEAHSLDLLRLAGILQPEHLQTNELALTFTSSLYKLKMSRYSFELLFSFLQEDNLFILLRLMNEHINIEGK